MSLALRGLHPGLRPAAEWVLAVANYYGIRPTVTSVSRTWHEQANLRSRWEAGLHPYPVARPGESAHNPRDVGGGRGALAWDAVLPDPYRGDPEFERWWKALREYAGFRVPANDDIHAELPAWQTYV